MNAHRAAGTTRQGSPPVLRRSYQRRPPRRRGAQTSPPGTGRASFMRFIRPPGPHTCFSHCNGPTPTRALTPSGSATSSPTSPWSPRSGAGSAPCTCRRALWLADEHRRRHMRPSATGSKRMCVHHSLERVVPPAFPLTTQAASQPTTVCVCKQAHRLPVRCVSPSQRWR